MNQLITFNEILSSYKIKATCIDYHQNEHYMFFDVELRSGGKVKDIIRFSDEIALKLKSNSKPIVEALHSKGVVRVGFVKRNNKYLNISDVLENKINNGLVCDIGLSISGQLISIDLAKNPHMIIAGTTGSGKSVLLHNIIYNLLNNNSTKLILMDPKNIEFSKYFDLNKNLYVMHSYEKCFDTIKYLYNVMEDRYKKMASGYNEGKIPYITCIIDEFADLIMQDSNNEFYYYLCRLAQKCRAAKIHLVIATQRPTVDIVNGTIKANFPARIACKVSSVQDSRVILDSKGAETLNGKGDALIKDNYRNLERFKVAYVNSDDVINKFKKNN